MLGASGVTVQVDTLTEQIYLPELEGALQAEMLAGARRYERLPVVLHASEESLLSALRSGYPVLVLQRLGILWQRSWHYAVLVGYDASRNTYVLRSGMLPEKHTARREFLRTWEGADRWAYVLLDPAQLPDFIAADALLGAAAAAETTGRLDMASMAYAAGQARWPGEHMFYFGAANVLVRQGRYEEAAARYEAALAIEPGHLLSLNNLGYALARAGCSAKAERVLAAGLALPTISEAERSILNQTLTEVSVEGTTSNCELE